MDGNNRIAHIKKQETMSSEELHYKGKLSPIVPLNVLMYSRECSTCFIQRELGRERWNEAEVS